MSERFYRTQILLEPDQHRALVEMAERKERSLSDLVREILREYLEQQLEKEQVQRELDALQRLRTIREEVRQRYGTYHGDIVNEIREEQMQDVDRVWRGED